MAEFEKWRRRRLLLRLTSNTGGAGGQSLSQLWAQGMAAQSWWSRVFGFAGVPRAGSAGGGVPYELGMQFANIPIAQGTQLVTTGIQCVFEITILQKTVAADAWDPITWGCWDTDNSSQNGAFESAQTTTKSALWTQALQTALTIGQTYSIDVTPSVQEVVDRPGWSTNNNLTITTDTPAPVNAFAEWWSPLTSGGTFDSARLKLIGI